MERKIVHEGSYLSDKNESVKEAMAVYECMSEVGESDDDVANKARQTSEDGTAAHAEETMKWKDK